MNLSLILIPHHSLTCCILMDFPIHIDTISMGLPIVYLKGSQVDCSKLHLYDVQVFLSLKVVLILANSADPDEMLHLVFTVYQSTCLGVSSIQRVKCHFQSMLLSYLILVTFCLC